MSSSPDTNQTTQSGALQLEVVPSSYSGAMPAPVAPALSPEQFAAEFIKMAATLDAIREEIVEHAAVISLAAPNADSLVNGLCQISKVCSSLNTWLLGAQLAIRLGQPITKR